MRKPINFVPEDSWLTFISKVEPTENNSKRVRPKAVYKCKCGNMVEKTIDLVKSGTTRSCGCLNIESIIKRRRKHGLSGTKLYDVWAGIKNRCYNENDPCYEKYGMRGVQMCDEWKHNPVAFIEWAKLNGWREGLQIDKDIIAKELGVEPLLYSPERCQCVTPKKNGNTTRKSRYIECNGITKTLAEWSDELGISRSTILVRLDYLGYSPEEALTQKDHRYNYGKHRNIRKVFTFNGKTQTMPKWSKELGISALTLHSRIRDFGWSIEKAFTTPLNDHKRKR